MLVKSVSLAAVIWAVFLVPPLRAHHSHGNYDTAKWTIMDGTVKELHLLVPHSWVYLDVKDPKGGTTTWALEATGPSGLCIRVRSHAAVHANRVDSGQALDGL